MLERMVSTATRWAGHAAAAILVAIAAHIIYEIVLRTFFAKSTHMLEEVVGYGMAAISFLALGRSLEQGVLMRVNVLLVWLDRWPIGRRIGELVCCASAIPIMALPIWFFGSSVWRNYRDGFRSGTMANVPAWLPESLLLFGMTLFLLQLIAHTVLVATGKRALKAADDAGASYLE